MHDKLIDFAIDSGVRVKTTRYFEEQVLRKRPYVEPGWCRQMIAAPVRRQTQEETVHNAFFDRNFREDEL